ncbi:MAG: CRISPR-associated endonuclease Cas1 [Caldilineales bacterium]|nr:CRISPR-associated endonuclease Cas1 [Caldilineales bacterium]
MYPVYVVQQGALVNIAERRLRVVHQEQTLLQEPLARVSQLILFGNIQLTTPAITALLNQGSEIVFLSHDGAYRGRLVGEISPHVPLRRAQYRRLDQPEFVLALAQGIVSAKLSHQRALLLRHNRQRNDEEIALAADRLAESVRQVGRRATLASLRGHEGSGTAAYFRGFRRLFSSDWQFQRRAKRPPPDAVNVLLSLGYTLLAQIASGAVQSAGLDPFAGFLHEYVYNRPSLALDLMEEFRPVVDGVVLWACRGGQITPADFTPGEAERPVILSDDGKRRFLAAFEQRMGQAFTHPGRGVRLPMRQCLIEQARQIANRVMEGQGGYQGMGFR